MNDDGKDDEAGGGGGTAPGADTHGQSRVPGSYLYPRAVRVVLGERLQRLGAEFRGLGDALIETGRLLPEVDGSDAALAIGGIRIEIRYTRELIIELEREL